MPKKAFRLQSHSFAEGQIAYVYKLDPPLVFEKGNMSVEGDFSYLPTVTEHVWVSGNHVQYSGPETYIFPSDHEGAVTSWLELEGSQKGFVDPDRVLRELGYEIEEKEE